MSLAREGAVVAVVLAAGGSRRLGRPKQLLPHRGVPLVRHIVNELLACPSLDELAVVVGHEREAVTEAVRDTAALPIVNDAWDEGMGSSVRCAATWAAARGAACLVVVLVDQPRLSASHVEALVRSWRDGATAAASHYSSIAGVPAAFDAALFDRLGEQRGDRGAGRVLRDLQGLAVVEWPDGAIDVDTEADVIALEPRTGS